MLIMSLLSPGRFFTARNFTSMSFQMAEFGILAIGMSIVILTGGIDLSISYTATLSGIIGALLMRSMVNGGMNPILTVIAGVAAIMAVSIICGAFNGYFVAYIGVLAILVTLGTRSVFEGIGLNLTRGSAVSGMPGEFQFFGNGIVFGIPVPVIVYILVAIAAYIITRYTTWGVSVYMLGGNARATEFSGVNTKAVLMKVYVMCGALAGIAGVIMASRYNSARTDYGFSYVMQSVAASVLGGTDINGGAGSVVGTVIAVAILQIISTGLNIFGLNRNLVDIINGLILLIVLTINFFSERRARIS
jgi:simple sugar transport system permease protein